MPKPIQLVGKAPIISSDIAAAIMFDYEIWWKESPRSDLWNWKSLNFQYRYWSTVIVGNAYKLIKTLRINWIVKWIDGILNKKEKKNLPSSVREALRHGGLEYDAEEQARIRVTTLPGEE